MKQNLQSLYESKIEIYEQILRKIKDIDMDLIIEFETEFNKIDIINEKIDRLKPELLKEKIMTLHL